MKNSRYWLAITFVWFFILYNIDNLEEPLNIASLAHVYILVSATLIIIIPSLNTTPFYLMILVAILPYPVLKSVLGDQTLGQNLPLTITEVCFIGITIFLMGKVGRIFGRLNQIVSELTIIPLLKGSHSFESGQGQVYREIRRARHYHRPAALLAISISEESLNVSLDRFIEESQHKLAQEYILARFAHFLVEELQDTDVITRRDNHFILLLPEANNHNIADIVQRIRVEAKEKLDLNIQVGISTFPHEAVTFERMLEQAEAKMHRYQIVDTAELRFATATTESTFPTTPEVN